MSAAGITLLVATVLALAGLVWRSLHWFRGRASTVHLVRDLASLPRRYLVDLHDVVVRDQCASTMHMFAAGGFLATTVLSVVVFILGIEIPAVVILLLLSCVVLIVGALMAFARRFPNRPSRLSRGAYTMLPYALAAYGLFYGISALPSLGLLPPMRWTDPGFLAALTFGAFGTLYLIPGMALGPMRHAFAGALHLAFHPRPERFDRHAVASDLRPIELESEKLGAETAADFSWKQLLSFDACVQCGRCEEVCPAHAAGAPLNPKRLIYDLWAASSGPGHSCGYAGETSGMPPAGTNRTSFSDPIVGSLIDADALWACTTCRACVHQCPMMIEHVDAVMDLRRFQTLERAATPGKGPEVLETLALTDTLCGKPLTSRLDWAADLDLARARERREFDVLLWLGEGSFELRNQRTLRALIKVLRAAKVDFAVLGEEELDCGDTARRLGDEATFQELAKRNIESLSKYRFARIVTADPHAFHCLKNEYPAFGGRFTVVHHTTLLAALIDRGRIPLAPIDVGPVTYHDACYLGRYNGEVEAPRKVLRALGVDLREMGSSGMESFCCGGGGGAAITDIPSKQRIPDMRMSQAKETGAVTVGVACPGCAVMLEGVAGDRLAVSDLVEWVAASIEAAGAGGEVA